MKLVSYNIRGLGGRVKKIEIRDVVMEDKMDLVCIQES